jgi:hypothetical protein
VIKAEQDLPAIEVWEEEGEMVGEGRRGEK